MLRKNESKDEFAGYIIKEIFYSLQGEGAQAGRPAVFCRFSGCNLWSGRDQDRASALCGFCDTDFLGTDGPGGGNYISADALVAAIDSRWPQTAEPKARKLVVCTGGEPLIQLDAPLVDALHKGNFEIAVETNGTQLPPEGLDWICVSPKAGTDLKLRRGNELKLIYPQEGLSPESLENLEFEYFYLQPMDGPDFDINKNKSLEYVMANPRWRLSLQIQKILGIK
jgi:7-carboxy-7-deazaguanine synthase